MRYFFTAFVLLIILVVSIAGFRGDFSRRPPLEIFPDMDRQLKLRPQTLSEFFADGRSSQLAVTGTVERMDPLPGLQHPVTGGPVYPFDRVPATTGQMLASTNFVELNPFPITESFMARGRERFTIHCTPCHGSLGNGQGITRQFGMAVIGNLHDRRIVEMPDGQIFQTISYGKNLMSGYAANTSVRDRWAIIAYLRALQLTQIATTNDVPREELETLNLGTSEP